MTRCLLICFAWLLVIYGNLDVHPFFQISCAILATYFMCGADEEDDEDEDEELEDDFQISFDESSIGPKFPEVTDLSEGHVHFLEKDDIVDVYQWIDGEWLLVADVPYVETAKTVSSR
jgi:hypothetical protein